jgi:hypothetical protein
MKILVDRMEYALLIFLILIATDVFVTMVGLAKDVMKWIVA